MHVQVRTSSYGVALLVRRPHWVGALVGWAVMYIPWILLPEGITAQVYAAETVEAAGLKD